MSGIATIINLNQQPVELIQIRVMVRSVYHRGPDGEQYFFSNNLALGHCLNSLDSKIFASQPFDNDDITVLLDGEIFNRKLILQKLNIKENLSDSEIIAQAYKYWQLDFLVHLDGKWGMIIYDKIENKLIAIRDRFAIKPLYFGAIDGQFCICSEIKQFTTVKGWSAQLNMDSARDFLAFRQQDHTNQTFFKSVKQLLAGEYLIFDIKTHKLNTANYYDIKKITPQYYPFKDAKKNFQEIVFESISRHLPSNGMLGTTLSGGLDSTIVTCVLKDLLQDNNAISLKALSFVFDDKHPMDETHFIDKVADFTKTPAHKIIPNFSVFQQNLSKFVYSQDEPIYTDSAYAQFLIFKQASEIGIRQVFDGIGADGLAGYAIDMFIYLKQLLQNKSLQVGFETLNFLRHNHQWATELLWKKMKSTNNNYSNWLNPNFLNSTMLAQNVHVKASLYDACLKHYQTGIILHHCNDRNASAFGIETYSPFYDKEFVELSLQLPDSYKIRHGKQKYILREAFKNIIPPDIYNRHHKIGFYNPGSIWIQQNPDWWLKEMRTIIGDNPLIFNPKILTIFENFALRNKLTVNEAVFWRVFFFGKWLQQFNVSY